MLHRMLGVVLVFCAVSSVVAADDLPVPNPEPHSASSTLALFALGVALLGIALLGRRSDKPRSPKD
jgi:uncharacterized membrane protein YfbV (UPF0208 family)